MCMSSEEKLKELFEYLLKESQVETAEDNCKDDYFCPMDYSGGNFDDCYAMGLDQGAKVLAETLLYKFFMDRMCSKV